MEDGRLVCLKFQRTGVARPRGPLARFQSAMIGAYINLHCPYFSKGSLLGRSPHGWLLDKGGRVNDTSQHDGFHVCQLDTSQSPK